MIMEVYWPTHENVDECIPIQAERLSPGTLWAVHEPMDLLYRSTSGGSVRKSDQDFLDALIRNTNGPLPVLGSAGSGKSHLVRWVHSALKKRPESDQFHIVRIRKNASLRSALESILEGLDGDDFQATRNDVAKLQQDQTPMSVAAKLTFHMGQEVALHCQKMSADIKQAVKDRGGGATQEEKSLHRFYQLHGDQKNGLQHLVADPYFQSEIFLKEDTPVFKYANRIVGGEGGIGVDDDEIHDFNDSFNLGHFGFKDLEISKLSAPAREYLNHSHLNKDDQVATAVVNLLSTSLGTAIRTYFEDSFRYGGGNFQDLFRDIRRYLKKDEKQLFVLVEDMAAIKAISETLIDCLLEDPDENLAPVHSVIASTSGAQGYQLTRDTILSRAGGEWVVDVDEQDIPDDKLVQRSIEMVGRYLNAARVGRSALDSALERGDSIVPNASIDEDGQEWDHSEAGYCLYPHTRVSIKELTHVYLRGDNRLIFSPRKVLQKIVVPLLDQPPWESDGLLLERSFAEVTVNTDLLRDTQILTSTNSKRLALFARIWGGNPSNLSGAKGVISDLVFNELGFAELENVTATITVPEDPEARIPFPSPSPEVEVSTEFARRERDLIHAWVREGTRLSPETARSIREFLASSFNSRLLAGSHFNAQLLRVQTNQVMIPQAIGNKTGNLTLEFFTEKDLKSQTRKDEIELVASSIVRYLAFRKAGNKARYTQLSRDLVVIEEFLEVWFADAFVKVSRAKDTELSRTAKIVAENHLVRGKLQLAARSKEAKMLSFVMTLKVNDSTTDSASILESLANSSSLYSTVSKKVVEETKQALLPASGVVPVEVIQKAIASAEKSVKANDDLERIFSLAAKDLDQFKASFTNFSHINGAEDLEASVSDLKKLLKLSAQSPHSASILKKVDLDALKRDADKFLSSAGEVHQHITALSRAQSALKEESLSYFENAAFIDISKLQAFNSFVLEWEKLLDVVSEFTDDATTPGVDDGVNAIKEVEALSHDMKNLLEFVGGSSQ